MSVYSQIALHMVDKHNIKKLLPEVEDLLLDINYCSDEEPEYISEKK